MSGIVGSKTNIRGSGTVAKLGTDGQYLLSSGAGKSANYETVASATYDDDKIQSNIALLGFKSAVNGSLAKYSLVDQVIDEYSDATGVDASASTNEALSSGAYHGVTGSYPTGGASVDTSVAGYRTHVFSANASLVVPSTANVTILVVAGGGSGGCHYGGGGGAGGLVYKATHQLTANTYDAVIGAGGAGVTTNSAGNNGGDSTWTINGGATEFTASGGGAGSHTTNSGAAGGSGGGAGYGGSGGAANQGSEAGDSATYGFGFAGGSGQPASVYSPGGGGGAGSVGQNAPGISGNGGTGKDYSSIFGTAVGDSGWFASGGGGGYTDLGTSGKGTASAGGGTDGGNDNNDGSASAAAQANTGGGSGGGGDGEHDSGNGGSGVILVRYPTSSFRVPGANLTLQSVDTTAKTANPDNADLICLIEDEDGTATLNTDIKGYVSEDSGVTFTEGTFVDEGNWGTDKRVIAIHDLDISAQSGSAMCYKITTHNQSAGSKDTRVHATSLGWK